MAACFHWWRAQSSTSISKLFRFCLKLKLCIKRHRKARKKNKYEVLNLPTTTGANKSCFTVYVSFTDRLLICWLMTDTFQVYMDVWLNRQTFMNCETAECEGVQYFINHGLQASYISRCEPPFLHRHLRLLEGTDGSKVPLGSVLHHKHGRIWHVTPAGSAVTSLEHNLQLRTPHNT